MFTTKPSLPYAGTSGWSGSDTSEERARRADSNGTTSKRQTAALLALDAAGPQGLTWHELADRLGLHHGSASGVLSVLHKAGRIARLSDRRARSKIYVSLHHVGGRNVEHPSSKSVHQCPNCGSVI